MADSPSLQVFDVTASALSAERKRLTVIATNIANAEKSGSAEHAPYRRQRVLFQSVLDGELRASVADAPGEFRKVHDPSNPEADAQGFILYPNVNVVDEMVDLIDASRTYEANLSALRTWKQMLRQTIDMAR